MSDKSTKQPVVVSSHDVHLDSDYIQWIHEIKEHFRKAHIKAVIKINSEQLLFNWRLGRDLVVRRMEERWGAVLLNKLVLIYRMRFQIRKDFLFAICGI